MDPFNYREKTIISSAAIVGEGGNKLGPGTNLKKKSAWIRVKKASRGSVCKYITKRKGGA